ncbi:calcium-transporting P-type ATPase, PMR1-type [Desulfofalx alkaliphila]|uniref:calcium-transporting P-type ATPase, PMR1-type n=1 Tax=Desulfofalx alkaliphila TaxID=105483 RepID=UPI0004E202E5|nr:calcium-transporting P-type ATPase, PMR1-type [Desulfofalx alkaliphila]
MAGRWYKMTGQEVVDKLDSDLEKGLDGHESKARQRHFGINQLAANKKTPAWLMFLDQFKDFMVLVLIAATIVSGFLQEWADAITIMIIVILNAVFGFVQEFRAEKSLEALKQMAAPEAKVIRGGREIKIPAVDLVPGDIVILEAGDKVPADLRLLETINLNIEESALTGESIPVKKQSEKIEASGNINLGDTVNMAYMGTTVTRGRAKGIVVATGMATEMGHIAGMIQGITQEQTPLQRRLAQMGKVLVAFCLLVCALVVVLGVLRGEPAYNMFLVGVSLAVAAIPEGLPAIVTISLAIGVQRMIKRNAIVRRLPAVETLGCATVICSDKTGTLTQNKMTVRRLITMGSDVDVSGEGYDTKGDFIFNKGSEQKEFHLLLKTAALCNNSSLVKGDISIGGLLRRLTKKQGEWSINGDPTEGALLVLAAKAGLWRQNLEQKEERLVELPFDSDRKRMTVVYSDKKGRRTAYMKGAPDVVLGLCSHYYEMGELRPLTALARENILRQNAVMADDAMRVLAMAVRELPAGIKDLSEDKVEQQFVFVGLAGMIDPPRPEAVQAVYTCKRAGIKTVMITGDHQLTARAIGAELGILRSNTEVLTGAQLDSMDDKTLHRQVEKISVYARVSPKHKLRIVKALKNKGHVVAMTGDGVNDAPAVKEADIGIAMGKTGTDVTKEASSMVLADDNFKTIVAAVEEGRGIYDNTRKFIRYLLSCNVGEVLVMFLAVLAGMPLPLVAIQILWMNLVTDGLPAMALGVDNVDKDIMNRPPRHPQESVFAHRLGWRIIRAGVVIALGTLAAFWIGLNWSGGDENLARTMAFNTLVFYQLFYVFVCRSEHRSVIDIGLFSNPYLLMAVSTSALLQLMVVYVPFFQPIFKTVPLELTHWMVVLIISFTPPFVATIGKYLKPRLARHLSYVRV